MKIFTIGFTKKSARDFFGKLRRPEIRRLVDVRLNNVSQLAGFTKKDDLRFFTEAICGIDRYKEFFAFVDHIRLIKDPRKTESLNNALVARVRAQNADRLWLSIPEAIEWRNVDHFRYRPSRQRGQYNDLHFSQLANELSNIAEVDLEVLRHVRVQGISAENGMSIYDWQLFKCLNHEVVDGNRTYVLNNGKWYEVASDFATAVADTCQSVRPSTSNLLEIKIETRRLTMSESRLPILLVLYPATGTWWCFPLAPAESNSATFTPTIAN